jgi:hypothetical protein
MQDFYGLILPPRSGRLFVKRSSFSQSRLQTLKQRVASAEHTRSFPTLTIYTVGSYGRLEASAHSDIDLFFVIDNLRQSMGEFRVPEIQLLSETIDIGYEMKFPRFSNDGEFLRILFSNDILMNLGSPADDYQNHFTARMLLLLEGRCIYGEQFYRRLLKSMISTYFRDYRRHPDDFRPTFLINDILRFWKTLCLNYEHKRNEEKARIKVKHKVRNFKLGFSRLLTCFATVAALSAFRRSVTPIQVFRICEMTPAQRLVSISKHSNEVEQKVVEALKLYSWFLAKTALSQVALENYMSVRRNRKEAFDNARFFGNLIFDILQMLDDENRSMRYLVV